MNSNALSSTPKIRPMLEGGKRLSYGARAINEGGYQSIPKLTFPGGMLLGCSAGFLNVPKIKGSHTAMKSGMVAAEAVFEALQQGEDAPSELTDYQSNMEKSWVFKELFKARNFGPWFHKLGLAGFGVGALELHLANLGIPMPWTFKHKHADHEGLKPADQCRKIDYPKPDGVISFRQDLVGLRGQREPRRRPADPPDAERQLHADRDQPRAVRCTRAALLPGRGVRDCPR